MEIALDAWSVVFTITIGVFILIHVAGFLSAHPLSKFLGTVGLYVIAFTFLGLVLGFNDANYWGEGNDDNYFLAMALLFLAIILICISTISLMQRYSQSTVFLLILLGAFYAYTAAWCIAWILFDEWGSQFIRGEKNAKVDLWRYKGLELSITVLGMIVLTFLMIVVFLYIILSKHYRVSVTKSIGGFLS